MTSFALAILAAACFSVSQTAGKSAMNRLSLTATLAFRASAGLVFAMTFLSMAIEWPGSLLEWLWLSISVALIPVAVNLIYFVGLQRGSLGTQVALFQSTPVFALAANSVASGTAPSWSSLAFSLVILLGCWVLAHRIAGGALSWTTGIASAVIAGIAIVVQNHVLSMISREALIISQNIIFFMLMATTSIYQSRAHCGTMKDGATKTRKVALSSRRQLAIGIGLAVFSGGLMLVAYDWLKYAALGELGPVVASCILLLRLPFAQTLGIIVFKEIPSHMEWAGAGIVLAGAFGLAYSSN